MKNKKRAFTLVELLAVIVILAVILVIAVPQIMGMIKESRKGALISSAKLIASSAETKKVSNDTLGIEEKITCSNVTKLNSEDYESCTVTFDENGIATVTLSGKNGGKFSGITCTGTKDNISCTDENSINDNNQILQPTSSIMAWTSDSNTDFHNSSIKNTITEISFVDTTVVSAPSINNTTSWDVSEEQDGSVIAWLDDTKLYIGAEHGVKANVDSSNIFNNFSNLVTINFNNKYDTSDVENMSCMFCNNVNMLNIDLSSFKTENVTDMSYMFYECKKLKTLDLSNLDTSNVTTMRCMFDYGSSTNNNETMQFELLNLSGKFSMESVDNTEWMFSKCKILKTILVNGDKEINNITSSDGMFHNCTSLIGGNGTKYVSSTGTYAKIDMPNQKGYFTDARQNLLVNNIELEYIESTGTQYINTEYLATINTKIVLEAMVTDTRTSSIWEQITGARNSYHASSAIQVAYNPNETRLAIDYGTSNATFGGNANIISKNTKFNVTIENNNHSINGTTATNNGTFSGTSSYPLWIFDDNDAGSSEQKFVGRIYLYKIYENNILVKDYIPVHNTILNTNGLYDKVEGKFYINKGTGDFTPGPVKNS